MDRLAPWAGEGRPGALNGRALWRRRGEGAARRRNGRPDRFGAAQEWHPLSLDDAAPARGLDGRAWLREARGLPGQVEPEGSDGSLRLRAGAVCAAAVVAEVTSDSSHRLPRWLEELMR